MGVMARCSLYTEYISRNDVIGDIWRDNINIVVA